MVVDEPWEASLITCPLVFSSRIRFDDYINYIFKDKTQFIFAVFKKPAVEKGTTKSNAMIYI